MLACTQLCQPSLSVAFIINAASFLVSAFTVWLIPEEATRDEDTADRMSGKQPRESFVTAMESLDPYDVGGFKVTYNAKSHNGSQFVDLTIVSKDQKFVR